MLDKFIAWAASAQIASWNAVTEQVLTLYGGYLEAMNYAPKTLKIELTTLKQVHSWLSASGLITGVAPIVIKFRRIESQPAYCYTAEEVAAMIAHCRETVGLGWLADVITALACTGLRISELAGLRWADVRQKPGMIVLADETGHRKPSERKRELKSGRSLALPIHQDLQLVLGGLKEHDPFVFHGPRGGALKPDTVRNILKREVIAPLSSRFPASADEQSFKDGCLHSFRHYFCSTCANSGVAERVVMEWLGHADSDMVRRYYHLNDVESRKKMQGLTFIQRAEGAA